MSAQGGDQRDQYWHGSDTFFGVQQPAAAFVTQCGRGTHAQHLVALTCPDRCCPCQLWHCCCSSPVLFVCGSPALRAVWLSAIVTDASMCQPGSRRCVQKGVGQQVCAASWACNKTLLLCLWPKHCCCFCAQPSLAASAHVTVPPLEHNHPTSTGWAMMCVRVVCCPCVLHTRLSDQKQPQHLLSRVSAVHTSCSHLLRTKSKV